MYRSTQLLNEGFETVLFRDELDSDKTACYLTAMIQGLVLRWSIYEFSFPLEKEADLIWKFLQPTLRK